MNSETMELAILLVVIGVGIGVLVTALGMLILERASARLQAKRREQEDE